LSVVSRCGETMPNLMVFNSISLDGYFTGANGDLSWAHAADPNDREWNDFVSGNAQGGGALVLGRVTYEMMVAYWPTEAAAKAAPNVAEGMNRMEKIVFSRTLDGSPWQNTRVVRDDPVTEIRRLKQGSGSNMVILGSGSIVSKLTEARLVDSYQFVIVPVVLGTGRTMFEGVTSQLGLERTSERAFKNGNVVVGYARKA
jgi:dihydrofolate reductase